jgi:hypothetical protein
VKTIYRASRINIRITLITCFVLWALTVGLGLTSTGTAENKVVGTLIFSLLFALAPLLMAFTFIELDSQRIRIVRLFFFRRVIMISDIQALDADTAFAGLFLAMRAQYRDLKGISRTAALGAINLYGKNVISQLVDKLVSANPGIMIDPRLARVISNTH